MSSVIKPSVYNLKKYQETLKMHSDNTPENSLDPILLTYINDKFGAGKKELLIRAIMWSYTSIGPNVQDAYLNELSDSNDYSPEQIPDRIYNQAMEDIKDYLLSALGLVIAPPGITGSAHFYLEVAEFITWGLEYVTGSIGSALMGNDDIDDGDKLDIIASEYSETTKPGFVRGWQFHVDAATNDLIKFYEAASEVEVVESESEDEVEDVQSLEELPETQEDAQSVEVAKEVENNSLIANFNFASSIIKKHYANTVGDALINNGVTSSADFATMWLVTKQLGIEFKTVDDFVSVIVLSKDGVVDPYKVFNGYSKQLFHSDELISKVSNELAPALSKFKDFYSKRF